MAEPITRGGILRFWSPLALTWAIMGVEMPIVAFAIAHLPDATVNLAAFGAAVAIAWLSETLVVNLTASSLRLGQDSTSYIKMRLYAFVLCAIALATNILLVTTPLLEMLLTGPVGMTADLAARTVDAYAWLLFWPALIGLRRFYQGQIIRQGQTRRVAYGTGVRLLLLVAAAAGLPGGFDLAGAEVGAIALAAGIAGEAIAARIMAAPSLRATMAATSPEPAPTFADFWRFYWPLTVMMGLNLAVGFLVTAGLARSRDATIALAAFPVAQGINFVARVMVMSFQDAAIALLGRAEENTERLQSFAIALGLAVTGVLALIAFTPISAWLFQTMMDLPAGLHGPADDAFLALLPYPAITLWFVWSRARLTHRRRTGPIATATVVETLGLVGLMALLIGPLAVPGAAAAGLAMVLSRLIANAWLERAVVREFRR